MKNIKSDQRWKQPLLIFLFYLVLAIVMYLFYSRDFIWFGDDIYYHLQRLQGLSVNFTDGLLSSNISTINFGKIGYGTNIFYPWLTLIPFRLIYQANNDWISTYYLGLAFYFLVSMLISHYSMKKFSGSTKAAIIFSVIYNFSTYRLIEMFTRAALAEYLASIFLPLVFLGFYELFFGDGKKWWDLAIGMSLVILTHVLTVWMCLIVFILLMIVFCTKLKITKECLLNLGKAVLTTILATLVFTVPFLSEELFQKYGVPDKQVLQGQDLKLLLISSITNNAQRFVENNAYNVGLIIILAMIVGVFCYRKFDGLYKAIYWVTLVSFLLTTNLFPWKIFQGTPIEVIQFPYRFLVFTTLFGTVIASKIILILFKKIDSKKFSIVILGLTLVAGGMWMLSINNAVTNSSVIASPKWIVTHKKIDEGLIPDTYLTQYIPESSQRDFPSVVQHQVYVDGQESIQVPAAVEHGNDFYFRDIKKGTQINLPFIRYKYTEAYFDGQYVPIQKSSRDSVQIVAPKDSRDLTIHLTYGNRPLFAVALIISLLAWGYLILSLLKWEVLKF